MRSRPWRASRTSPALASTSRCLVTACRVTSEPSVSCAIDCGPLVHRRTTSASRVSSPSAAKTGAARATRAAELRGDMLRDELQLLLPTAFVHLEGERATLERDAVETRLGH